MTRNELEVEVERLDKLIKKHVLKRNRALVELADLRTLSKKWDRAVVGLEKQGG